MSTTKTRPNVAVRYTCLFRGRVQGVGFRFTVHNIAHNFNVSGYVRNLPDGRVEVVIEGDKPECEAMTHAIRDRMAPFIREATTAPTPATGEFPTFSICR